MPVMNAPIWFLIARVGVFSGSTAFYRAYFIDRSIANHTSYDVIYRTVHPATGEEKYLRAVPRDPFTQSSDTWQIELSDPEPGNPSAEPAVFDVNSGSDLVGINGTPYAEW